MCSSSSVNIWSEAWQPQFLILHWPWRMSLIPPPPHLYFHHCRLHSPFYSQRRTAQTQLPVFTKLRAFLLFCLIKIKCICCPPFSEKKKKEIHNSVQTQKCCLKRLPTNILINGNHRYLLICDSFNHVYNLPWMTKSHSTCTRLCLDCFLLNSTSWLNVCWVQKYTNASDLLGNLILRSLTGSLRTCISCFIFIWLGWNGVYEIQFRYPTHTLLEVNNINTSYTHNYVQCARLCFLCFIQWFWRRVFLGQLGRKMKCCCFILFLICCYLTVNKNSWGFVFICFFCM